MYAKIFRQIYDSTVSDDWRVRTVFMHMLVLADRNGVVDMTPEAISRVTGIPLDMIEYGIEELQKPDGKSRSFAEEGRRIVLLCPEERTWGWRVVNYRTYRMMGDDVDRMRHATKRSVSSRKTMCYCVVIEDKAKFGVSPNPWARAKEAGGELVWYRPGTQATLDRILSGAKALPYEDGCYHATEILPELERLSAQWKDSNCYVAKKDVLRRCYDVLRSSASATKCYEVLRSATTKSDTKQVPQNEDTYEAEKSAQNTQSVLRSATKCYVAGSDVLRSNRSSSLSTEAYTDTYTERVPRARTHAYARERHKGASDGLGHDEAKAFLADLFGRGNSAWSYEEEQLLSQLLPLRVADKELIARWFSLPDDHPVFEVTRRKQTLTSFLRDFNAELDKMRRFSDRFVTRGKEKKEEPPAWREFFRWKYGEDVRLPKSFADLHKDQRDEYARDYESFLRRETEK